ncbi:MAG: lysophospholipid acyltransferase family protein [Myxococcota bacterium]
MRGAKPERTASEERPISSQLTRPPWHGIGFNKWLFYRFVWRFWSLPEALLFRSRGINHHQLPGDKPYLLLPNHNSVLDPFWAGFHVRRPVRFMASAHLFRSPIVRWPLTAIGGFPKMKFVKDRDSMETLNQFYADGVAVMVFPEGNRSWDGRPEPVLPGIGRLIKRLDARIVFARNLTGHLFQPRWAKYPRYVPIRVEYDGPHTFDPDTSAEEITDFVRKGITIDATVEAPKGSYGIRLAHGLPGYLWACPRCGLFDGLQVDPRNGNNVICRGCGAGWRVDVSCRINPLDGGPRRLIADVFDEMLAQFGEMPVADRARFDRDGVILEEDARIDVVPRRKPPEFLGAGVLRLFKDRIELCSSDDGAPIWAMPFERLKAISVEVGSLLQIRDGEALYRLSPSSGTSARWFHFLNPWWTASQSDSVGAHRSGG